MTQPKEWHIDADWSVFLDRDGVINRKLENDYVKHIGELDMLPGALEAIQFLSDRCKYVFIVTNQQCVGKGIITEAQLEEIHRHLLDQITTAGGRIDRIYYAPQLASENSIMRKPAPGMALKAKEDFPEVDFQKSVLIGDSVSDVKMGKAVGMKTVFIGSKQNDYTDFYCASLSEFSTLIG